ncbi:protein of unknown function [Tenacibaculum sp. 190130A14a]|uniref:Uncharacterized protein n=1 Tax=Tenacibaculum polynesiense TaxID=3137857 RepID=A0ABM9P7E7_9FLAO
MDLGLLKQTKHIKTNRQDRINLKAIAMIKGGKGLSVDTNLSRLF